MQRTYTRISKCEKMKKKKKLCRAVIPHNLETIISQSRGTHSMSHRAQCECGRFEKFFFKRPTKSYGGTQESNPEYVMSCHALNPTGPPVPLSWPYKLDQIVWCAVGFEVCWQRRRVRISLREHEVGDWLTHNLETIISQSRGAHSMSHRAQCECGRFEKFETSEPTR